MTDLNTDKKQKILCYQELATNAWPAKVYIFLNGWILRISEGITKRANSVVSIRYTGHNLLKDIESVETNYAKSNLPTIFQLPDYFEPTNLQTTLLSLGYKSIDESLVMMEHIKNLPSPRVNPSYTYSIESQIQDYWFQALAELGGHNPKSIDGQKAIISRIPCFLNKAFCYAQQDKKIVAIGLAVIERGHMGIFDLIVHNHYRREGIAQSIVASLIEWGQQRSIDTIYLQVQGDNVGAMALYRKLGLQERYRYRYLIK